MSSGLIKAIAKFRREHPDLSYEEIAERMQISTQMLIKYIKGTATPRESTLALIAQGIGVDVEELRKREEEMEPDPQEEETEPDPPEKEETKTEIHIVIGERLDRNSGLKLREIVMLYFFSINELDTRLKTHEINAMADEFLDRIAKCINRDRKE